MSIKKYGFTLIEVLVILCLIAVLCAIGLPGYQAFMESMRQKMVMQQLYHAIMLARSEAIKRNRIITLCASEDGYHCIANWTKGYLLFVDEQLIKPSQIIQWFKPIKAQGLLLWKCFPKQSFLQLSPEGFTNSQNGTFYYCPKNEDVHFAKALFVSQGGHLRFSSDDDHDGIDEDSHGKPLHCH